MMELKITGTNLEITERVRQYAQRKINKLDRHWPNIIETKVEISEEQTKSPDKRFLVRVNIDAPGAGFHGEERGEDQLKAIDKVSETMIRQLEHYKGKLYDRSHTGAPKEGALSVLPPERTKKIVKVKNFLIKPMDMEEAIDEMELLRHDFFLFVDADTEQIKLLYRRKDGNYGLIEPKVP